MWPNFLDNPIGMPRQLDLSLASKIVEMAETMPNQEYIKTLNKWLERMRLCVENKGIYFEHLKNKINDA